VAVVLGALSLTFMGFFGYTWALQRMVHLLMDTSGREPSQTAPRPDEAAVRLKIYIRRLNLAFLFGTIVYVVARDATGWQTGLGLMCLCGVGGILVAATWLQPRSQSMVSVMTAELEHQRSLYRNAGEASQVHAVEIMLARLRVMTREPGHIDGHR
jgi:hypothetical protein